MAPSALLSRVQDTILRRLGSGDIDPTLCSKCDRIASFTGTNSSDYSEGGTDRPVLLLKGQFWVDAGAKEGYLLCRFLQSLISLPLRLKIRDQELGRSSAGKMENLSIVCRYEKSTDFLNYSASRSFPALYSIELNYTLHSPKENVHIISYAIEQIEMEDTDIQRPLQNHHKRGKSTSSSQAIDLAKQWLEKCDHTHSECAPISELVVPTRLIDVGTSGEIHLRLCESVEKTTTFKYMTLSHCWGKVVPKRLLLENLNALKEDIIYDELSKTFQDAVLVTRNLGIRYLWIDSLCIIQNSKEDWLAESVKMAQVYAGSYCSLSASSAFDGSEGMLYKRDTRLLQPFQVQKNGAHFWDHEAWNMNIENSPLASRAWVFQERTLARRNLHFTSLQIFWECNESQTSETLFIQSPNKNWQLGDASRTRPLAQLHNVLTSPALSNRPVPGTKGVDPVTLNKCYTAWWGLVGKYSAANLTKETDRLVAIAGLAEILQPLLNDRYEAGLWKSRLHHPIEPDYSERSTDYIAPSWSWASIIGQTIMYNSTRWEDVISLIEIEDITVRPVGFSQFSQVTQGYLALKGSLAKLDFHTYQTSMNFYPDTRIDKAKLPLLETSVSNLFLLHVVGGRNSGLILQAIDNEVGKFKRIGVFNCLQPSLARLKEICQLFDSKSNESGLKYTIDKNGRHMYSIKIV